MAQQPPSHLDALFAAARGFEPRNQFFKPTAVQALEYSHGGNGLDGQLPGIMIRSPPQARDVIAAQVDGEGTAARAGQALGQATAPDGSEILVRPLVAPSKPGHTVFGTLACALPESQNPSVHGNDIQLVVACNMVGITKKQFNDLVVLGAPAYAAQDVINGTVGPMGGGISLQRGGMIELYNTGTVPLVPGQHIAVVGIAHDKKTVDGQSRSVTRYKFPGMKDEPYYPLAVGPVNMIPPSTAAKDVIRALATGSPVPSFEYGVCAGIPQLIKEIAENRAGSSELTKNLTDPAMRDLVEPTAFFEKTKAFVKGNDAALAMYIYFLVMGMGISEAYHRDQMNKHVGVVTRGAAPGGVLTVALKPC